MLFSPAAPMIVAVALEEEHVEVGRDELLAAVDHFVDRVIVVAAGLSAELRHPHGVGAGLVETDDKDFIRAGILRDDGGAIRRDQLDDRVKSRALRDWR